MSEDRIKKFLAKPVDINIKGEDISIYPLKLKDIDLLFDLDKEDKRNTALKEILKKTLKDAFPGITDEDVDDFSVEYVNEFIEAILKVNGLDKKKVEVE